ncbi:MAG: SDR family oxidoreductase [Chloroflexi bacterium]|nr:MAG: SDR family oxidoreductase [Chloroflexota bacterium]
MNLVILGATGGTGRLVVEQALSAGHTVTALVRSPEKLTSSNSRLRVITGLATDAQDVARALAGADALISTLGGSGSVIADSTQAIVDAARQTGLKRVVVLSSFLVERQRLNVPMRLATGLVMGAMVKDKTLGEEMLRSSGLDWTIIYASPLTDGPATGSVSVLAADAKWGMSHRISRADVATWLVQTVTGAQYSRRSVAITGGTGTGSNRAA